MDHLIKRNGRRSTDVILFAVKDGHPVWPVSVGDPRGRAHDELMSSIQKTCMDKGDSILLLTLDLERPEHKRYVTEIARSALVERNIDGIDLPANLSVWVFAEKGDFPELFADPAIAAVAQTLERGTQDPKRQLGDPINYVPSWKRDAIADQADEHDI